MKIFVNGDSHTIGSELYYPTQDTYIYRLAKLLGGDIVANPAIGGASNDRILRTTEDYLRDCERDSSYPDLIVIGWSESYRTDWFVDNEYRSVFSQELTPERSEEIDNERAKFHSVTWRQTEIRSTMAKFYHEKIYDLHLKLEHLNIPHLFFMGVNSLHYEINEKHQLETLQNFDNSIIQYDWKGSFWKAYEDISFLTWGRDQGYEITKWLHLREDAHAHFAEVLYNHIIDNNILQS